jgi:hypothetical protein
MPRMNDDEALYQTVVELMKGALKVCRQADDLLGDGAGWSSLRSHLRDAIGALETGTRP